MTNYIALVVAYLITVVLTVLIKKQIGDKENLKSVFFNGVLVGLIYLLVIGVLAVLSAGSFSKTDWNIVVIVFCIFPLFNGFMDVTLKVLKRN